jgi:hypothetical protein
MWYYIYIYTMSSFKKSQSIKVLEETDTTDKYKRLDYEDRIQNKNANMSPQQRFDDIVKEFYGNNPFMSSTYELEVRFGTRNVKQLTKPDYDNVIKKIKSMGFYTSNPNGEYSLRIQNNFIDNKGTYRQSNIRTEINGLSNIQLYCKTNDISEVRKASLNDVKFTSKKFVYNNNQRVFPVDMDDFNFRVSLQSEEQPARGVINEINSEWLKTEKTYRYMNRVTFIHEDYPIKADISIVKSGNKTDGTNRIRTIQQSNVFNNNETIEIELEIDNYKIGPGTNFNTPELLLASIRKVIKFILSGLQGTNFPVSYPEQKDVIKSYMKLKQGRDWNDESFEKEYRYKKRVDGFHFIGPSSVTLQMENISPIDENTNIINIRNNYTVTEKADGERRLMYINDKGKIYLISSAMNVMFTGARTNDKDCFDTILDGELISHDKNRNYINLYAGFDIYYYKKQDVRAKSFMLPANEKDPNTSRYYLLKKIVTALKPVSVVGMNKDTNNMNMKELGELLTEISPIRITAKEFYPLDPNTSIFSACQKILTKSSENLFEYNTDGLIFTPAYYGVGSNKIGTIGTARTWKQSFKWKPPEYNTIDFLVTTLKEPNGKDVVKTIYEEGVNLETNNSLKEYTVIQLRCSFNQKDDGYINPCQDVIDDKIPSVNNDNKNIREILPVQFYPTDPYDSDAGIGKIIMKKDDNNISQMFTVENDEIFVDNTIVEFSYDLSREKGWRWVPLRVRHDKTAELLQGKKNYGNAYHVANDNWKSIHNPITLDMITTGLNIPDIMANEDKYYNNDNRDFKTAAMKKFHNLYVKRLLITSVCQKGDTLIDYACGKAGDLPKWITAKLSFVFGIDIHLDNLENKLDGACARFLNERRNNKIMPDALFVNGNSAFNIKSGQALLNDKAKEITHAIFGSGTKDEARLGKGVFRQYGKVESGFNVSSCQFALHYFLENNETLQGFLRNLAECTKLNGYFIGTSYDGKLIFDELKNKQKGDSIMIIEDKKKVWEITKQYSSDVFEDDSSSIGYKIDIYQDSINKTFSEFLINFNYFTRVMEAYGFNLVSKSEANLLGLPDGTGTFNDLYLKMLREIENNKLNANPGYLAASNMTSYEKKISFLNRYFVYKKVRHVDTKKIVLEMSEYNEIDLIRDIKQTEKAVDVAKKAISKNPKVKKLNKKLLLIDSNE